MPRWQLGLLVVAVACIVRTGAWMELRDSALLYLDRWQDSEMHFVDEWARAVADGDLLLRTPLAPPDTGFLCTPRSGIEPASARCADPANAAALRRWTNTPAFWQAPLYPYLVATVYHFAGADPRIVFALQSLLGVITCWFVFLIAARLYGDLAGMWAGIIAALLGTGVYYEMLLTEGTCSALAALVTVDALLRTLDARRPVVAGVWAGIAGMTTIALSAVTMLPVVASFAAAVALRAARRRARTGRMIVGLLYGVALMAAPLVARNVEVGAPPLSIAARTPVDFVMGNALGATATARVRPNATTTTIFARAGEDLDPRADLSGLVATTIATHPGDTDWLWLVAGKFAAFWRWFELPADANYYYFIEHVPVLSRFLLAWSVMAGLAALGLASAVAKRTPALLLAVWMIATAAACALLFNLSLLRFPAVLVATLLAGNGVATLIDLERQRRYVPALLSLAFVIGIDCAVLAPWQVPFGRIRPEYFDIVNDLAVDLAAERQEAGQTERALATVSEQLRTQPRALVSVEPGAELALDPWVAANARSFAAVYASVAHYAGLLGYDARAREASQHAEQLGAVVEQWRTWPGS